MCPLVSDAKWPGVGQGGASPAQVPSQWKSTTGIRNLTEALSHCPTRACTGGQVRGPQKSEDGRPGGRMVAQMVEPLNLLSGNGIDQSLGTSPAQMVELARPDVVA